MNYKKYGLKALKELKAQGHSVDDLITRKEGKRKRKLERKEAKEAIE